MRRTTSFTTLGTAALGAAVLAACGSSGGSPSGTEGATEGGLTEAGELTSVTIGTQPIVDSAPLYLGVDQGFFREEGIDLTIESAAGGAAVIPSVVSGDFEFGRGNILSTMIAREQGLPLTCIANANSANPQQDFGAVVVMDDSEIQTAADLSGATISVNTLENIGDTTIRSIVADDGGDPESLEFVELGFPEAPAALSTGQVDAVWVVEPFVTEAVDLGGRVVFYNFSEFHPELDVSCVFTSEDTLASQPELVESFQRAVNRSLEFSQDNPDEVRRITGTYTEIDEEVLARMALPVFRVEFSEEAAQLLGERAVEYGTLSEQPDLDALLP